jgi:hypothetical protein
VYLIGIDPIERAGFVLHVTGVSLRLPSL